MTSTELQALKQSILDDVRVMMQTTGQVTQYIGARYVPLIAEPIEWSDQREYEPLTIVTNQGNSYTSRQFVPKGTPITNGRFWAATGNFNAQIEKYRQEVAAFDARITTAQNTADGKAPINHASESTEYGVGNGAKYGHLKLSDSVANVDDDANSGIAASPKSVIATFDAMNYKGVNVVAFGDSITHGYGLSNPTSEAWPAVVCSYLGAILHNYAVDGASFASGGINTQVDTAKKDSSFANESVQLVLIGAGINDHGKNHGEITSAIKTCINNIKASFPNADIMALPCLCASTPLDAINQGDGKFNHASEASVVINTLAEIPGVTTFSRAYSWLQTLNDVALDSVHPNKKGANIIACNVLSHIKGGMADNRLLITDLPYDGGIKIAPDSFATFYTDGITWEAYGKIKFSNVDALSGGTTFINLPEIAHGRQNLIKVVPLWCNIKPNHTPLAFVSNGSLKSWNIDNSVVTPNVDYYWSIKGICGM